jgi:phosphoribosylformylglycinamidine cyclo-ligase
VNERHSSGYTYEQAGVDITSGARAKERIGEMIRQTYSNQVLGDFGHFGGMFRSPGGGSSVLVASADSVGTKVLLAVLSGEHRGIGIDLVNHSVNDILCCGARPLFFLDYFATSSLDENQLADIVEGMTSACVDVNCALIGGETAQLPGIYQESTYDLAGFIVGTVDEGRIVDGSAIRAGQSIVGFASNGLHTNGYSLARSVFELTGEDHGSIRERLRQHVPDLGESLSEALMRPHKSYFAAVFPYVEQGQLSGMAHITGGGIAGNLERIVPENCVAVIDCDSWEPGPIFQVLQSRGRIDDAEMFDVFNMGIGFIVVADSDVAASIVSEHSDAKVIGEIRAATEDDRRVRLTGRGFR